MWRRCLRGCAIGSSLLRGRSGRSSWGSSLFLLALVLLTRAHRIQRLRMGGEFTLLQPTIRSMIAQLDQLQPELPRGTRLLFINNPFPDDYGVLMLLRLYFRDHTLELDHAAAGDCRHNYVMVWRGGA